MRTCAPTIPPGESFATDVNENGKKAIGLEWRNNNSARLHVQHAFSFAVTARLRRENA